MALTQAQLEAMGILDKPTGATKYLGDTTITYADGTTKATVGQVPAPTPQPSTATIDTVTKDLGLTTPPTVGSGGLLDSLRRSFMTGLRPNANVRTFGGDMAINARRGKNPTSLRIGMSSRLDTKRKKEIVARQQKNTLGLNMGSSVGLQV